MNRFNIDKRAEREAARDRYENEDTGSCSDTVPVVTADRNDDGGAKSLPPLPWKWSEGERDCGEQVTSAMLYDANRKSAFRMDCGDFMGFDDDTAEFVVRAVNAHDALLDALKELVHDIETDGGIDTSAWPLLDAAKAAIAKAEGR